MRKYLQNIFYDVPADGVGDGGDDYLVGADGAFAESWKNALPEELRESEAFEGVENFKDMATGYAKLKTAPPAAEPPGLIDKDGNFKENWWDDFDELKDDAKTLKLFSSPQSLAKSLANTKRMVGKPFDPANFADDNEKAEFYRKLGVPDEAKDYGFEKPENFPADRDYDSTHDDWFANIAKKYNLPKEAAEGIRNEFFTLQNNANQAATTEMATQHEESQKELENEWGAEGSSTYEANLKNANEAIDALNNISERDIRADIKSIGMDDSPILFRLLAMIGENVGESELAGVDKGAKGLTKQQIEDEIRQIESDPEFLKPHSKKQKEMVNRRSVLRHQLYGETQQ